MIIVVKNNNTNTNTTTNNNSNNNATFDAGSNSARILLLLVNNNKRCGNIEKIYDYNYTLLSLSSKMIITILANTWGYRDNKEKKMQIGKIN